MDNRGPDRGHTQPAVYRQAGLAPRSTRRARQVRRAGTASGLGRLAAQTLVYSGAMLALLLAVGRLMGG